jgi:hypothetical protein
MKAVTVKNAFYRLGHGALYGTEVSVARKSFGTTIREFNSDWYRISAFYIIKILSLLHLIK